MGGDQQVLLELLRQNDDRAYRLLYSRYYAALRSFATHYVTDEAVAMDLIQDVFIGLLNHNRKFGNFNEVKFFLYSSLRNRCISYLRRQKLQDRYVTEVMGNDEDERLFTDRVLEEDVYAGLLSAIAKLPPQCGRVMQLVLEGHGAAEIASLLNISVETVKDHKSSGKKKLYHILKDSPLLLLMMALIG